MDDRLLLKPEVARRLGVCERTVEKLMLAPRGRLPHVRIGRAVRFRSADVDRFVQQHTIGE